MNPYIPLDPPYLFEAFLGFIYSVIEGGSKSIEKIYIPYLVTVFVYCKAVTDRIEELNGKLTTSDVDFSTVRC